MALLGSETRDALCSTLAGLGGCGRWAAAIGRVRVWKWVPCVESEEGRLPRIRRVKSGLGADLGARIRRDYGVNGGFLESSGRRERESLWSNDGGRGEATDGFMSSSVQVLGGGRRREWRRIRSDVTLLQANSAFPTSLACTWECRVGCCCCCTLEVLID